MFTKIQVSRKTLSFWVGVVIVSQIIVIGYLFYPPVKEAQAASGANVISNWSTATTDTVIWDATEQTGVSSWSDAGPSVNQSMRLYIKGAHITDNATAVRLVFKAGTRQNTIDDVSIGLKKASSDAFDFSTTPTRVTFGGSNAVTTATSSTKTSDYIPFTMSSGTDYFVAIWGASYRYYYVGVSGVNDYMKTGQTSDDTMLPDVSGYGAGGNTDIVGLSQILKSVPVGANVYQAALTTKPTNILFDSATGTPETSVGALTANNQWYWSNNLLYVYSTSDPSTRTIEARNIYYLRADGTAANKAAATSCSAAATAMSIATHNVQVFLPSDTIILCNNGGNFQNTATISGTAMLIPPSSGSAGYPITYDGYNASGGNAVIDDADAIGPGGVTSSWTLDSGNIWKVTLPVLYNWGGDSSNAVYIVLRDEHYLQQVTTSKSDLNADGQWYWDGTYGSHSALPTTTLYIYSADNPNSHTIIFGNRDVGIFGDDRSYVTYENMTIQHVNEGWAIETSAMSVSTTGNIIKNITSIRNSNGAFMAKLAPGNCNTGDCTVTNLTIQDSTDDYSGVIPQNPYSSSIDIGDEGVGTTNSPTAPGVSGVSISNVRVSHFNTFDYGGHAIASRAAIGIFGSTNVTITDTEVDNSQEDGILVGKTDIANAVGSTNVTISKSSIHDNGLANDTTSSDRIQGIDIHSGTATIEDCLIYNNYGAGVDYTSTGSTLTLYNNTIYGNGLGVNLTQSGATLKNNIIAQNTANELTIAAGKTLTSDYNDLYHSAGGNFLSYLGTAYNFANWKINSSQDSNSISADPLVTSATDFHLQTISPAIDTGADVSLTSDYTGSNLIYGTPDMGAYEYQPSYTMGTDLVDPTGSIRIYSNGKYRYTTVTSGAQTADFQVAPVGGYSTSDYSKYMDVSLDSWLTTDTKNKQWTATSTIATTTPYTIRGLTANSRYQFTLDGNSSTTAIVNNSQCTDGICLSDSSGNLTFTYQGGYSTNILALNIIQQTNTPTTVSKKSGGSFVHIAPVPQLSQNPLPQITAQSSATGHQFSNNLKLGSNSADVKQLQIFLNTHGFVIATSGAGSPGHETNTFGALTKKALIKFQEANAKAILKPVGLTKGTGNFAKMTRDFINSLP